MFKRVFLKPAFGVLPLAAWVLISATGDMRGQTAITDWTLSFTDGARTNDEGIKFQNQTYAITSFATGTTVFNLGTSASDAYVRRNQDSSGNGTLNQSGVDNNNRSSVWNTQYNGASDVVGSNPTSLSSVLLNNNAIMGADNLFTNGSDAAVKNTGNVERVDFYFGGTVVNAADGLTIFDRGLAGAHDNVKIAVFTGWSGGPFGSLQPTAYSGNVVTLTSANYGSNLDANPLVAGVQDSLTYSLFRYNNGNDLTDLDEAIEVNTQGVAGAFISFADLGIATGTTIYGYSIMAADVTTNVANLANWNNATYYPTGTSDANGGIDLMSFNGRIARPVPEPSTYGALLLGGCVGVWMWRRRVVAQKPATN